MAKQLINIGRTANDRSGDPLRSAFIKINDNFDELYALTGGTAADLKELAQDYAADMFVDGTHSGITVTYNDANNTINLAVTGGSSGFSGSYNDLTEKPNLFSGVYNDLTGKPFIPADVSDLTDEQGLLTENTNKIVNGVHEAVLDADGNLTLPDRLTFSDDTWQSTAFVGQAYSLKNINGSESVTVSTSGTIETPLLLPTTFTAVLDTDHMVDPTALSDAPWEFVVTFAVNPNGVVETQIGNNTPWFTNPGYADGKEFTYTEADHGIPGYTFTLGLYDVIQAGPAGWTTNLLASIPPTYPSTLSSLGAIKLTANENSLVYGTDGVLNVESIRTTGTQPVFVNRDNVGISIDSGNTPLSIDIGDFRLWDWARFKFGTGTVTGNEGDVEILANVMDPENLPPSSISLSPQGGANGSFVFGGDGKLVLPAGGDIVDSNGTSVLGGGGNANTGDIGFSGNILFNSVSTDQGIWIAPGGESTSYIQVPGNAESDTTALRIGNASATGRVEIGVNGYNTYFEADGSIRQNNSFTRTTTPEILTGTPTVIWSGTVDYISSAKLVIQVEGNETGDDTGWHAQACEAIIASRGYANGFGGPGGDPAMTVYGVVHTSVAPLVTFTVQRNPTTKLIEVVGTLTGTSAGNASLRIHSVEMSTTD